VGFSYYPKNPIVVVACPLNVLIECHMKELRRRGISCTCFSADDGDKDGALVTKYAFILEIPRRLSSIKILIEYK